MIPGSPEWHARVETMLANEARQPEHWWYLSFATATAFLGGAFVRARGPASAIKEAHTRGINPGGEVAMVQGPPVATGEAPPYPINKLLSKEEMGDGERLVPVERMN
jgi:hypothetical protein